MTREFTPASQLAERQAAMLLAGLGPASMLLVGLGPLTLIWAAAFAIIVLPHCFGSTGRGLFIATITASAARAGCMRLATQRGRRLIRQSEESRRDPPNQQEQH